ncbi:hypothetical protein [Tropicibacter oceani]|uniref:Uncharacterized protein n=1 Tax=Tropicibacter oceani TaxID=3058420 RepID=A0ABY8QN75_9RHOB|nr:hypothetical protein [Tropicibacter oceani]WGW06071.1 hypothetical protein QF118_19690 [Tropicibacter oceani]
MRPGLMTLLLAAGLLASPPAMAGAGQIGLVCAMPQGATLPAQRLCAAMAASLGQVAPGAPVVQGDGAGQAALQLTLQVTRQGRGGLTGHLQWQDAGARQMKKGPDVQFNVMDTGLDSVPMGGFTDALVASDPGLLAVLRALDGH